MTHSTAQPHTRPAGRPRTRVELHLELCALRRRLADAWWHEEPLETIESLERRINEHLDALRRHSLTAT